MSTLKSPKEWFAAGRIMACHKLPYFSAAVMGLVPYEIPKYGTLGVTARGVLIWDPELAKKWSVENLAWVLLHEAGHYLREHATREKAAGAEHTLWNIAGDAEINDDLVAADAKFPPLAKEDLIHPDGTVDESKVGQPSGIVPETIGCEDGRLAEEYYAHLRKNAKVIRIGMASMGPSGGAGQKGKGQGQGQGKKPAKGQGGGGTIVVAVGHGKGCGSGAGCEPSPEEAQVPGHLGKSQAEQKRIQREVAEAVRKHVASKGRGTVPGGLQRWAEELLGPPRVPWQQKLAKVCRTAVAFRPGAGDYRYDRPSRRQGAFGYGSGSPVFPALRMPVPQVGVLVDTSGSMGDAELKVGLEETKGIMLAVGAHIDFYACDAELHSAKKVRDIREACKLLKGGGGTDMKPAFEHIVRQARRPEVLVVVTDGQIGDPGPQLPGIKVIWLVLGSYRNPKPAPWGEVIDVDPKDMGVDEDEDEAA
jgi:predicted metal-dependent peptidase